LGPAAGTDALNERQFLLLLGIKSRFFGCPGRSLFDVSSELTQLA